MTFRPVPASPGQPRGRTLRCAWRDGGWAVSVAAASGSCAAAAIPAMFPSPPSSHGKARRPAFATPSRRCDAAPAARNALPRSAGWSDGSLSGWAGTGPPSRAWMARALPLSYTRRRDAQFPAPGGSSRFPPRSSGSGLSVAETAFCLRRAVARIGCRTGRRGLQAGATRGIGAVGSLGPGTQDGERGQR